MKTYTGRNLDMISYPMGGIGAGMVCMQGNGSLGSVSVRNRPDLGNEPMAFSAVTLLGTPGGSRVLEAPVPDANIFARWKDSGNGLSGKSYGLPRFSSGEFGARFPFATITLHDETLPLAVEITGWSPFIPNNEDDSSLPFAALEYTFTNTGADSLNGVYYFCSENLMKADERSCVRTIENGFVLEQRGSHDAPHLAGAFCASVDEGAYVDTAWFRGGWFDKLTMLWNNIANGACADKRYPDPERGASPGGTLAVPFRLAPGEIRTIKLHLSWFVPFSDLRTGKDDDGDCCGSGCGCKKTAGSTYYSPWYASRFKSIEEANAEWLKEYARLKSETKRFSDCLLDSTLPEEILEAVSANLCILKSPTILRQTDGRLWGWEGCFDAAGCCDGSCTHVWNYAQAVCNLFPRLERTLRETEYFEAQDDDSGHQNFRSRLPIRKTADHSFHAACDGQLGGIIKVYRDWRISGDTAWMRRLWGKVRQSLDFCIGQWDTQREGVLKQPHHNTYDIEFWGPDGMCTSFYLGALKAACEMGRALGEDCREYETLYEKGRAYLETNLYNGEYFYQQVMWKGLEQKEEYHGISEKFSPEGSNSETRELLALEGPKYQYGTGCISDGVLGVWLAEISGLTDIVNEDKLRKNLESIYRYNFKADLSSHANPQRPGYALGKEAGLLLCTWPRGGKPSLPFAYCDEVWTGIEYQVASHLISKGFLQEGLGIVKGCRARYDGTVRNPFDEYECGHWYARAMASYALLQAYTGVWYDNLTKTLYAGKRTFPYRTFLCTAGGYGTVDVSGDAASLKILSGNIEVLQTVME